MFNLLYFFYLIDNLLKSVYKIVKVAHGCTNLAKRLCKARAFTNFVKRMRRFYKFCQTHAALLQILSKPCVSSLISFRLSLNNHHYLSLSLLMSTLSISNKQLDELLKKKSVEDIVASIHRIKHGLVYKKLVKEILRELSDRMKQPVRAFKFLVEMDVPKYKYRNIPSVMQR